LPLSQHLRRSTFDNYLPTLKAVPIADPQLFFKDLGKNINADPDPGGKLNAFTYRPDPLTLGKKKTGIFFSHKSFIMSGFRINFKVAG
jgi:hypothetical protein